jgi:hypothetical protein
MNWTLVDEIGIQAAPCPGMQAAPCPGTSTQLRFPTYATKAQDGTYLIGDELGTDKLVPFRFESRVIRVNNQGGIAFDSLPLGIDDGFGCLLDEGSMAILRRTKWELLIVSAQGDITDCLPLSSLSKRMPRYVSWTDRGTFLLVFCNRVREVDIIEMDLQGRLLWFLPPNSGEIGIAGSVQWLPTDTFLIADPFRHVVVEIDRGGNVVWQFGEAGKPSKEASRLSSPGSVRVLPDGRRLIADTRNHRVLLVNQNGTTVQLKPDEGELCDPMNATVLSDGHFLICDTGNHRVVETDPTGRIVWQFGNAAPQRHFLSYPRSVELTADQKYVIADTAHDRIVEIEAGQVCERPCQARPPLFWPRSARTLPSGGMLIADGRNGRVLEVAADGHVLKELYEIDLGGRNALRDPHDVRMLPNGHLLIVDSSQDLVVEADWSGEVHRAIGDRGELKLSDPHTAQRLDDGCVVIADTGNHRILIVGPDGACVRQMYAIHADSSCYRLNFPRYMEIIDDGTMVIADTGNNRVLAATIAGRFIWEFSRVPGTPLSHLNQPRWVKAISGCEVVICDHVHHRILRVKCDDSQAAANQSTGSMS